MRKVNWDTYKKRLVEITFLEQLAKSKQNRIEELVKQMARANVPLRTYLANYSRPDELLTGDDLSDIDLQGIWNRERQRYDSNKY